MGAFNWRAWLKSTFQPKVNTHRRDVRLSLESLEGRLAPATYVWTGVDGASWSDAKNWSSTTGTAPTGVLSSAGTLDDLVFPATGKTLSTNNNLTLANNATPEFGSITFSGAGYTLGGNAFALGDSTINNSGNINLNPGATGEVISAKLTLSGASGTKQFFNVAGGSDLTISGNISGTNGSELTKQGSGVLYLSGDNSGYTGNITMDTNAGTIQVSSNNALGTTSGQTTTVGKNDQLQINSSTGVTLSSNINLILNGAGVTGNGSILNVAGANTWAGTVELDSAVTFGVTVGSLTIGGQITDLGSGYNVTKEGAGTLVFGSANDYHGTTTINNGILDVQAGTTTLANGDVASALGVSDGTSATQTLVNPGTNTSAALVLDSGTATGIKISNQIVVLNGTGISSAGAIDNIVGNNVWDGPIILGSSANGSSIYIGAEAGSTEGVVQTLTVTGIIQDPTSSPKTPNNLVKVGDGTLVLAPQTLVSGSTTSYTGTPNTYTGKTTVSVGTIDIEDSQALGKNGGAGTTVSDGATLQLDIRNIPDSVTGNTNHLKLATTLNISGDGVSNVGALYSATGINTYTGNLTLTAGAGGDAAIGVDPDPNQSSTANYFTNDYSLTITGDLGGNSKTMVTTPLTKVGGGQLILPNASTNYAGNVKIAAGWITVENNNSLGVTLPDKSLNDQPLVTIQGGAALHLLPAPGQSLTLTENFAISGLGITHAYSLLNQEGAIESLDGVNYLPGKIQLLGQSGLGANLQDPTLFPAGQLYVTGELTEGQNVINVDGSANGGAKANYNVINTKSSNGGTLSMDVAVHSHPDDIRVYLGDAKNNLAGSTLIYDSDGPGTYSATQTQPANQNGARIVIDYSSTSATINVTDMKENQKGFKDPAGNDWTYDGNPAADGTSPATVTYSANNSTYLTIVVNEYGNKTGNTVWSYTAKIQPNSLSGELVKLGSQLLVLQDNGQFSGGTDIREGVVLNQSKNGLGSGGTVLVEQGASLALGTTTVSTGGGLQIGYQVNGLQLELQGSGNNTLLEPAGITSKSGVTPVTYAQIAAGPLAPFFVLGDGLHGTNGSQNSATPFSYLTNGNQTGAAFNFDQIVAGDFQWNGGVSLDNDIALQIEPDSRLNITGTIDDANNTGSTGSDLIKFDTGELMLSGSNTYNGVTYVGTSATTNAPGYDPAIPAPSGTGTIGVNEYFSSTTSGGPALAGGVVTVANSAGLGGIGSSEMQAISVSGSAGTFTVTYLGQTTPALAFNDTAADVQSKLQALSTIGMGNVSVTKTGSTYFVTFTNSLAGFNLPLMSASGTGGATASVSEVQLVAVTATAGTFTLTFNGKTTGSLAYNVAASGGTGATSSMQNALAALTTVGNGNVSVTSTTSTGTTIYRVVFTGSLGNTKQPALTATATGGAVVVITSGQGTGGTVVQNGSALQLQGNITVAGESLIIQGTGASSTSNPETWFNEGPAPLGSGQTLGTAGNVSGRVTGVAVDPMDSTGQTIYISTAGGGAWKTTDGGTSWFPLFDGNKVPLFAGTIVAVDPGTGTNPYIYLGTGEANNSTDSYGGTGVWLSADGGHNWSQLGGSKNPLVGLAVTQIVVDPKNPTNIFVATSDQVYNGSTAPPGAPSDNGPGTNDGVGVYRFDGTTWTNLTNENASSVRTSGTPTNSNLTAAPKTVGPDDNFLISFPQVDATWSGLALIQLSQSPVLVAALGTANGRTVTTYSKYTNQAVNGVYMLFNPNDSKNTAPSWYIGNGVTDGETSTIDFPQSTSAGRITLTGVGTDFSSGKFQLYAAISSATNGSLIGIYSGTVSTSAGKLPPSPQAANAELTWSSVSPSSFSETLGNYTDAILATSSSNVYFGGQNNIVSTTKGGSSWTDFTKDANGLAPTANFHSIAVDSGSALSGVVVGTDGGVWLYDTTNSVWKNLNGNLAISMLTGLSGNPSSATSTVAGSQASGIDISNGTSWTMAFDNAGSNPYGGTVAVDPQNASNIYAWLTTPVNAVTGGGSATATLYVSTDGGKTWTSTGVTSSSQNAPIVVDPINEGRVLVGGSGGLVQSTSGGASGTWTSLGIPSSPKISSVAISTYQGTVLDSSTKPGFIADPDFTSVSDLGANSYDPNAIYASDGTNIYVSLNNGANWKTRNIPVPKGTNSPTISGLVVDPRNSDIVFAIANDGSNAGIGRIWISADAGQDWTSLTGSGKGALPDIPVWALALDPRNNNLYVGTDQGVFAGTISGGAFPTQEATGSVNLTYNWGSLGTGLTNIPVRGLLLNQTTNTLTIATYGRSEYTIWLNSTQAGVGALRTISGSAIWTGPINLAANTVISVDGTLTLQAGALAPQLNIVGPISDLVSGSNNYLTIGNTNTEAGTVILSGKNTYSGTTEVQYGVVVVNNPDALGAAPATTTQQTIAVHIGSNTDTFKLTFNGATTGSLAANIPASGGTTATDSIEKALDALSSIGGQGGSVSVTQSGSVYTVTINGLTGTLPQILAIVPSGESTTVDTSIVGGTVVDAGTALEIESDLELEPITLNGNGLSFNGHNTGSLRNISNNNTYTGTLTLAANSTIGTDSGSSLTIGTKSTLQGTGTIIDGGTTDTTFSITKESSGMLVLGDSDNYGGTTTVNQGILRIGNGGALGTGGGSVSTNGTTILDGAQLQIQGGVTVASEALRVSGSGITNTGALESIGGANTWNGTIALAQDPAFLPPTTPPTNVIIGVLYTGPNDQLTIGNGTGGAISQIVSGTGLTKVGAGRLILDDTNTYTGPTTVVNGVLRIQQGGALSKSSQTTINTGTALEIDGNPSTPSGTGITVSGEPLYLNGPGQAQIQAVTISGTTGTFTLGFNGKTTSALPFNASAAQVQSALNALTTISANGSVSVTQNGHVYYVVFGGGLVNASQSLLTVTGTAKKTTDPAPLNVVSFGTGTLHNISGFNTWGSSGNILLPSGPSGANPTIYLATDPSTQLTISSIIQDATATGTGVTNGVPAPANLNKIGTGTLAFAGNNTYTGQTNINEGALNIQNAGALGGVVNAVQQVTLSGPLTGTFTLSFGNKSTAQLSANYLNSTNPTFLADIQNALNGLSTIGGVGGYVAVTWPDGTTSGTSATSQFLVTFGGTLGGTHQAPLKVTGSSGQSPTVASIKDGSSGTVVASGAALQLQGGIDVTSEALTLNGTGLNNGGALENVKNNNTWGNPSTPWTNPLTIGSDVSIGVDGSSDTLSIVPAINDGGKGFGVTEVGPGSLQFAGNVANAYTGLTQVNQGTLELAKTPTNEIQTVTVIGSSGTFTLTFNNQTTGALAYNVQATGGSTLTSSMQNALAGLSSIGTNNVKVTSVGNVYTITFINNLGLANEPQITASGTGGATPIVVTLVDGNAAPNAFGGNLSIGTNNGTTTDATVLWQASNQVPNGSSVTVNSDGLMNLDSYTDTVGAVTIKKGQGSIGTGALTATSLTMTDGSFTNTNGSITLSPSGSTAALDMTGGTIKLTQSTSTLILNGDVNGNSDSSGTAAIVTGSGVFNLGNTNRTVTVSSNGEMDINSAFSNNTGDQLTKQGTGLLVIGSGSTNFTKMTNLKAGTLQVDGTIGPVTLDGGTLAGTGTVGNITPTKNGQQVSPGDPNAAITTGILSVNNSSTLTLDPSDTLYIELNSNFKAGTSYDQLNLAGAINLNGATLSGALVNNPTIAVNDQFTIVSATGGVSGQFAQGSTIFISGKKFTISYLSNSVVLTRVLDSSTVNVTSSTTGNTSVYGQDFTVTATLTAETGASFSSANTSSDSVHFYLFAGTTLLLDESVAVNYSFTAGQATTGTASLDILNSPLLTQTLVPGTYTVYAEYSGDPDFYPTPNPNAVPNPTSSGPDSTVPFVTQTVTKAATTTALSSNVTSSSGGVTGQSITIFATISPSVTGGSVSGALAPSGNITFTLDGKALNGPGQVQTLDSNGSASITLPTTGVFAALAGGKHSFNVVYNGDSNYTAPAAVTNLPMNVNPADTTVSVDSSTVSNTSTFGDKVTFTATVTVKSPGSGNPTGVVRFYDGTVDTAHFLGFGNLSGTQATYTTNALQLTVGSHTIIAVYSGDTSFNTSQGSLTQTVNKIGTTAKLSAAPSNMTNYGQSVAFTLQVSASNKPVALSGNVTFNVDGGTIISNPAVTLINNQATYTVPLLGIGTHTIVATYNGDSHYGTSQDTVTQTVEGGTTTKVSVSPTTATFGSTVTFTASVTTIAPGTPVGTLSFQIGTGLSAITLSATSVGSGKYQATSNTLAVGSFPVTATFTSSNSSFFGSTGSLASNLVITKAGTSTSVSASPTSSMYGEQETFTVTVAPPSASMLTPTGTVNIQIGTGASALVFKNVALTSGQAQIQLSNVPVGTSAVTATYNGDDTNGDYSSSSGNSSVTVTADATNTSVSTTNNNVAYGGATITATVQNQNVGLATPTGNVSFFLNGSKTAFDTEPLIGGVATMKILPIGTYSITASFHDPKGNFGDSSDDLTGGQVISAALTDTSLNSTNTSAVYSEPVITATVDTQISGLPTPTGTVSFFLNGSSTAFDTQPLVAGVATMKKTLDMGNYTIDATYNPDSTNFATSSDTTSLSENVAADDTTVTVSSSASIIYVGQSVTFTANVAANTPGVATPTGSVDFEVLDLTTLATQTFTGIALKNGQAQVAVNNLGADTYQVTATHSGSQDGTGDFNGNVGVLSPNLLVNQDPVVAPTAVPTSMPSGHAFLIELQFQDQFGNLDPTVNGKAVISIKSGPTGGTLGGTLTVDVVNGIADFKDLTFNKAGKFTLQAGLKGLPTLTLPAITATANHLVPTFASTVSAGLKFQFTAKPMDASGAVDSSFAGTAILTLVSGPSGGKLTGTTSVKISNHAFTFTPIVSKSGTYLLRLNSGALTTLIQFSTVPPSGRRVPKPGVAGAPVFNYIVGPLTPAAQAQLHTLEATNGFHAASPAPTNLGLGEKWFQDASGNWFTITRDGRIRAWTSGTGLSKFNLAIVDPLVWDNPTLLFNA